MTIWEFETYYKILIVYFPLSLPFVMKSENKEILSGKSKKQNIEMGNIKPVKLLKPDIDSENSGKYIDFITS